MSKLTARFELLESEVDFPEEGDLVYLAHEVDKETHVRGYIAQSEPFGDKEWGLVEETEDGFEIYAMGTGIVTFNDRHTARPDLAPDQRLIRVPIYGSVNQAMLAAHNLAAPRMVEAQ